MRAADIATLVRIPLVIWIVYLILIRFYPLLTIFLLALTIFLDAFDGYLAVREISKGRVSFAVYVKAATGNSRLSKIVKRYKEGIASHTPYGPRMDIAGDRAVEYIFWILFTYLNIIPLFVIILIVIRHSFVDALMGSKGTSSKMKTRFAKIVYASPLGRSGINVVKFLTFSYLTLVYTSNYPVVIGYLLAGILLGYILIRGAAEIYESFIQ